jgi:hypothetical protein
MRDAMPSLETFTAVISDRRGRRSTVDELGAAEPLRRLPALAFPAKITVDRVGSPSVQAGCAREPLTVRACVGERHLEIVIATGIKVARY